MIRRNEPFQKEDQRNLQATRDFTRILRAARPYWEEFLPQPKDHIARGLVCTESGTGLTADLCFDKPRKRIRLVIRLHPRSDLSPSQLQSVSKVQNETEGLSSIAFDKENRIITIRSQSVLPASIMAEVVVPQVVEDAITLLGDDNLKDIVEQSLSY